ncbi:MAG TPA: hypothetical protein VGM82_01040 [Gemmatimonadaceae bacterium]|jgi:hypothetical protein
MADGPWWSGALIAGAGGLVGFGFAFKMARYQADLTRHREHQRAAITLHADLQRIETALAEHAQMIAAKDVSIAFAGPTLHRWAEPAIAALSSADPVIVADCLRLDRQLQNFAGLAEQLHHLASAYSNAHGNVRRVVGDPFLTVEARRGLKIVADAFEGHLVTSLDALAELRATLQGLTPRVSRIAWLEEPAFMELAEERLARRERGARG